MLARSPSPPSILKRVLSALNPRPPAARPFSEMGSIGTAVYGGYIQTRERSPQWVGAQRYITISDMAVNASIVAAGVHYFLNLIAHPRWTIEPADGEGVSKSEALRTADFVDECLQDLTQPWSRVVRRAGTYRFYGFGIQEWTAKRRADGRVGLASIEARPQSTVERWSVSDGGDVEGVWQRAPQTGAELGIPRRKLLYLVDDALSDSPEGVGVFRHLAEPWERLKQYYALEARAFERDLRGTPIGRVPYTLIREAVAAGDITKENADTMVEAMEKFVKLQVKQSDTAITIDSIPYYSQAADGSKVAGLQQWGLELLQGGAAGMAEVAAAITRTQTEMARLLTVEHLMMGESSGNRALSEDKSRNLYLIANAVLGDVVAGVGHDVIPALCDLNGVPEELRPTPMAEDVSFKDAEAVAAVLAKMAQAGATLQPDDPVIEDVRTLMGVSPPPPPSPELMGLPAGGGKKSAPGGKSDEADEDDDELIEKANPNHDERGRFASGDGSGGGGSDEAFAADHQMGSVFEWQSMMRSSTDSDGWSRDNLYHGSGFDIDQFRAGSDIYLAGAPKETEGFAEGLHLGGGGKNPSLYAVQFRPGRTWHIQSQIDDALADGDDLGDAIDKLSAQAKKEKFSYLVFDHPSFGEGEDFTAVVSLFPNRDLRVVARRNLKGLVRKTAQPRTLYVKRRLLNAGAVRAWAASQGIASALPAGDMHVTVAFSREPVDWSVLEPQQDAIVVNDAVAKANRVLYVKHAVHQFPSRDAANGALVLRFSSTALHDRWRYFRDAGASWDYPEYQSHVTITYSVPEADVGSIEPYRGPLVFGPEEFAEVNDDWAGEVAEESLSKVERSVPRRRSRRRYAEV